MPINSRQKGKRIEREVANTLKKLFPKARRGLTQSSGTIEPDVVGTPFWVEVKGGKNPPKPEIAFKQAFRDREMNQADDQLILVAIRADRQPIRWFLETSEPPYLREVTFSTLQEYA